MIDADIKAGVWTGSYLERVRVGFRAQGRYW
jgi:hypothetical protein